MTKFIQSFNQDGEAVGFEFFGIIRAGFYKLTDWKYVAKFVFSPPP